MLRGMNLIDTDDTQIICMRTEDLIDAANDLRDRAGTLRREAARCERTAVAMEGELQRRRDLGEKMF